MAARDTHHYGLPMLDFFSADSNGRGDPMDRDVSAFQQVVSPPVALSLRTRESSALALKHLFDQIYSNAESTPDMSSNISRAFEKKDLVDKVVPSSAFQGARSIASQTPWQASSNNEEPSMHHPEVDTSLARNQQAILLDKIGMAAHATFLQNVDSSYQAPLPQAMTRTSAGEGLFHYGWMLCKPDSSSPSLRQPTAQLIIFYSGTVNVYDDVPDDKANAIMLLAGTGSMKQSGQGEKERCTAKPSLLPINPKMGMSRSVASPMAVDATGTSATTGGDKSMGFTSPFIQKIGSHSSSVTTVSPPPLLPPALSVPAEFKQQAVPKRPHAGIELPHARKASLARFLEKRKDRVHVKQPEAPPQSEEKGWDMSKDDKSSSPKKPCLMVDASSSSSHHCKQ